MALKSETMATMITLRDEKMTELAQLMDSYVLEAARLLLLYEPGLVGMESYLSTNNVMTDSSMVKDEEMTVKGSSRDGHALLPAHQSASTPIWMELELLAQSSETMETTSIPEMDERTMELLSLIGPALTICLAGVCALGSEAMTKGTLGLKNVTMEITRAEMGVLLFEKLKVGTSALGEI
jgi:hypothetical protein